MRDQRRIGSDYYNNRTSIECGKRRRTVGRFFRNFLPDWNSSDAEIRPNAIIALDEHAYCVVRAFNLEFARRSSDAAFEFIANHSRAAANVALLHRTTVRGINRVKCVFGL